MKNQVYLSLNEAAKETKRSKGTISKAISSGKLSYISKGEKGYQIDPAELFRVFPPKQEVKHEDFQLETLKFQHEIALKDQKIINLENQLQKSEEQCEKWEKQADKITVLLSNENPIQPKTTTASKPHLPKKKKGFFRRLLG